jgi:hypothetical protein
MTRLPSLTALPDCPAIYVRARTEPAGRTGNRHPRLTCCRRICARKNARHPVGTDGKPREFAHPQAAGALRPLPTTVVPSQVYCRHPRGPGSKTRNLRSGPTSNGLTWDGPRAASQVAAAPTAFHPTPGGGMPPGPRPAAPRPAAPERRGLTLSGRPAAARHQVRPIRRAPRLRFLSPRAAPAPAATAARPGPAARRPAARHCSGWGGVCRCATTGERRSSDLRPMPAVSWQRALPAKLVGSTQTVNLPSLDLHSTGYAV